MATESTTTMSTTERIVSALTAALPLAGQATFRPRETGHDAITAGNGGVFTFRATGWPGTVTLALTPSMGLPEIISSDPAAALTPAVESGLATVGASGGVSVEPSSSPVPEGSTEYVVAVGSDVVMVVSVHEGQPLPAAQRSAVTVAAVDEDFLRNVHRIRGVDMELSVVIGRTTLTVAELLRIKPGQVLELDRAAGAPADVLVNGRHLASGEVVVQDLDFAVKITSIRDDNAETEA